MNSCIWFRQHRSTKFNLSLRVIGRAPMNESYQIQGIRILEYRGKKL
jgi:hypothetical protein